MPAVRCPHCGRWFVMPQVKGRGAHYGREIRRLGRLHKLILSVIVNSQHPYTGEDGRTYMGLTKREISAILHKMGERISGNALSGRLSELLGAGYLKCVRTRVKLYDPDEKKFRFQSKPIWMPTEKALDEAL